MRLEQAVRQCHRPHLPLSTAAGMIREGRVQVSGITVTRPSHQILVGVEPITLDSRPLDDTRIFHRLLLFNKPAGAVCAGEADARSIFRLLPQEQRHPNLSFFGRLDASTTGLMLLGTDGGVGAMLTDPDSRVTKEYWAILTGLKPLCPDIVQRFEQGVELSDGTRCRPAELEVIADSSGRAADGSPAALAERTRHGLELQLEPAACDLSVAAAATRRHQQPAADAAPALLAPSAPCGISSDAAGPLWRSDAAPTAATATGAAACREAAPMPGTGSTTAAAAAKASVSSIGGSLIARAEDAMHAEVGGRPIVKVTLHEGRYHQVKRMLGACDGAVSRLHREAYGGLRLSELQPPILEGSARAATAEEMRCILAMLPDDRDAVARAGRVHERIVANREQRELPMAERRRDNTSHNT